MVKQIINCSFSINLVLNKYLIQGKGNCLMRNIPQRYQKFTTPASG